MPGPWCVTPLRAFCPIAPITACVTAPVSSVSFMIRSSFPVSAGSRLQTSEIGAPPLSTRAVAGDA
jgi:hypothetical protein